MYVIGTNRHESRRIDNQLRGRAGRQGDPGSSRFFVSLEDDLLVKYGIRDTRLRHTPESIQRLVEGQNLDIREFLNKYEGVIEGQRQAIQGQRQAILEGATPCSSELDRLVSLSTIDELWSEYLASIAELKEGTGWVSYGGREPLFEYLRVVHRLFPELQKRIAEEIPKRLAEAKTCNLDPSERGATWTYLSTDRPLGSLGERFVAGLMRKAMGRRF
jgi:preprotein translocase subunit SecA